MAETELANCRQAYATRMLARMGISGDERLRQAFATVPREDFLGPPPWRMANSTGYRDMPSTDPAVLYQDVLVALQEERQVNNGSPSLHALGLHWLAPQPGEAACHIGAPPVRRRRCEASPTHVRTGGQSSGAGGAVERRVIRRDPSDASVRLAAGAR